MIGRLERDGHVTRDADKLLAVHRRRGSSTPTGIVRRHRLIERFLTDVLGIPWDEVHEEAERLEHAMSPVLEERMLAAIGDAKTCPHGHPIEVGKRIEGVPLADVEPGAKITVLRFENEAEDLLHYLKESVIEPGESGTLTLSGDENVELELGGPRRLADPLGRRDRQSCSPTRRRRRAPRCRSSSCSRARSTAADVPRTSLHLGRIIRHNCNDVSPAQLQRRRRGW